MAEQFYTILTQVGRASIANASALGNKVNFTHFALGDGNGSYYNPTESQEGLKNEVWRGQINNIVINKENPNWIILETIIPADQGGFMIREAGVFDDKGNLLAIGKYPETYKPAIVDGSAKDLYVRMILEVVNTSVVTMKVDPTVILATKKDIEILENKINNIKVPVTSVNEKTGDIVLTATDIKAKDGITLEQFKEEAMSHIVDNMKHVVKDGTLQNGLNAEKVGGKRASDFITTDGGMVTGPIIVSNLNKPYLVPAGYTALSGWAGGALSVFGNNCYIDGTGKWRYLQTHATAGAMALWAQYSNHGKLYFMDTGLVQATADTEFTPTNYEIWTQKNFMVSTVQPSNPATNSLWVQV